MQDHRQASDRVLYKNNGDGAFTEEAQSTAPLLWCRAPAEELPLATYSTMAMWTSW
jgi:hypothetical protein